VFEKENILFRWLFVGEQTFTDPFFDDTISICRKFTENQQPYKSISNTHMLTEWTNIMDSVEPTAFIFHVSRCGSTLVSQALGMDSENISLSEVPVFDELLRVQFQHPNAASIDDTLTAAIKWYGNKRNGNETRLFIKTDSWHLLFYQQLRALYPNTPFVILYRQPAEVLFSQQRQKGMHAVSGLIEPAIFGFDETMFENIHPDDYMSIVLEKYYQAIINIIGIDSNVLLVNYQEGITTILEKIAAFVGMELTNAKKEMFAQRSNFHAKNGTQVFAEKYPEQPITSPNMATLQYLYAQIEQLRLQS
jgi:hypothetical protein